jgi:hypothetical protein
MKLPQKQVRSCLNGLKKEILQTIKDETVTITSPTEGNQRFNICLKICKHQIKHDCFFAKAGHIFGTGQTSELMPY